MFTQWKPDDVLYPLLSLFHVHYLDENCCHFTSNTAFRNHCYRIIVNRFCAYLLPYVIICSTFILTVKRFYVNKN